MRCDACRRCLSLPTAVGDPDGVAAGCCFCFVFLGRVGPRSAGADGRVLGLTAFLPSERLGDRRNRLYLPSAGGDSDGVAAGCACLVVSLFGWRHGRWVLYLFRILVGPTSLRIQL